MKRLISMLVVAILSATTLSAKPIKALIISGQNTAHNWAASHLILRDILEDDGYEVDLAMSPAAGEDMSQFNPSFKGYKLVVLDYCGDYWCDELKESFVKYVQSAKGGLVIAHSSNTAFKDWEEYNKITALGAFGSRGEDTEGLYTEWKDDKVRKYEDRGVVGHHGKRHDFTMVCRNENHPAIDKTLPKEIIQVEDEVYDHTKGPANIKDVLYTAYSETETGGTGREEILIFTVDYGKARIFHTMIGHVGPSVEKSPAMHSDTFVKTFLAGARWASGRKNK